MVKVWHCPAVSPRPLRPLPQVPPLHGRCAPPAAQSHHLLWSPCLSRGFTSCPTYLRFAVILTRGAKVPESPRGGAQGADSDLPGPGWRLRDWWAMKGVALALLKEGVGDSAFTLPAPRAPAVCTAGRTVPWPGGREALVQQGQRGHSGAGDKGKGESGVAGAEQGAPPAFTASPAGYLLPSGVQHHRVIKPEETASPAVSLSFSGPRLGTGGVDSPKVMGLFHKAQGPRPVVTLPCVLGGCTSRLHPLSRGRTPRVPALPGWVNFGKYLPLSGPQFPQQ